MSQTGAIFTFTPSESKNSALSYASSSTALQPPFAKVSLGERYALSLRFGLLLALTTVPPSSSVPIISGIFAVACMAFMSAFTSSFVLPSKSTPNSRTPPMW